MKIDFEDFTIEYVVQYGKGKKFEINIDSVGFVTLKVPNNTKEEVIIEVIKKHKKWIKDRLDKIEELKKRPREKSYDEEGKFLFQGKEYFIHELIDTEGLSEEELKTNLKKFYISNCKKIVQERVKMYESILGVKVKSIEIDESKTKWGSCTSDKKLTFNYRLAMAPIEVVDYVVVHELCHILHMNHDRSFWRKVGSIIPDYKKREEYLERYGQFMTL